MFPQTRMSPPTAASPRRTRRPTGSSRVVRLLGVALAFSYGCSAASAEYQLLNAFFHSSRIQDPVALASDATVAFDPRRDGSVQTFTIQSIGDERTGANGLTTEDVTVDAQVRALESGEI